MTMQKMIGLLCLLLLLTMAGCTTRNETRIAEAQARTDQARYDSQAAQARADGLVAQAQAEAQAAEARSAAAVGVAQANSQTAIVREQEKTTRETAWLSTLPVLLLIVLLCGGLVVIVWQVLWFRGKAYLMQVEATMLPAPQQWQALPQPRETQTRSMLPGPVAKRANDTGLRPVPSGACWQLVDVNQNVVEVMEPRRRG